jgi:uncharacterized membrane protein (UPF0127 family)
MTAAPKNKLAKADLSSARPLIAIVGLAALLIASAALAFVHAKFSQGYVKIGEDLRVNVSVADNDATREKGLSGKEGLAADEGMLFIFDHPQAYGFWMKEMKFPIDILWIADGTLVDITTDAAVPVPGQELPVYYPKVPVDRVLEVRAGFAREHGLRTGLPVAIHVDKDKQGR